MYLKPRADLQVGFNMNPLTMWLRGDRIHSDHSAHAALFYLLHFVMVAFRVEFLDRVIKEKGT